MSERSRRTMMLGAGAGAAAGIAAAAIAAAPGQPLGSQFPRVARMAARVGPRRRTDARQLVSAIAAEGHDIAAILARSEQRAAAMGDSGSEAQRFAAMAAADFRAGRTIVVAGVTYCEADLACIAARA